MSSGQPTAEVISYIDVVKGSAPTNSGPNVTVPNPIKPIPNQTPVSTLFSELVRNQASPLQSHKGEPAMFISAAEEEIIAEPFKFTLIGKFSWGRPAMVIIRKEIQAAGFAGPCYVGLIDSQHIVFRFEQEVDFQRMWLKRAWNFRGFTARMFKWSTEFSPEMESPIVPIWINFPMLPLYCFNKKVLFTLASAVGKPLKTDTATAAALQTIRPSVARVCVEADISKSLPERVWISKGEKGMWQEIQVEDKPNYCSKCRKLGHLPVDCNPSEDMTEAQLRYPQKKVWIPKETRNLAQKSQRPVNTNAKVNCSEDTIMPSLDKDKTVMESEGCSSPHPHTVAQELVKDTFLFMESNHAREGETSTKGATQMALSTHVQMISTEIRSPIVTARVEEGRIPISIDFQNEQEPKAGIEDPPMGGEGGRLEIILPPMAKVPSTSEIRRLQLISTESETDNQIYGGIYGSSEWEEETDSAACMEILAKSKHKPRKGKNKKQQIPTSSRKLRSFKQVNAFGYESR